MSTKEPLDLGIDHYAMERFLYRLAKSKYAAQFILKGALMLRVWQAPEARPTMDVDLLGITSNDEDEITAQIREILSTEVGPDGLHFEASSIKAERITEDADYQGLRIRFRGTLGSAKVNMQLDIGFGDVVFPEAALSKYPTILDFPAPQLRCYSRESAIAEKLEAMVKLGELNSRMKDFSPEDSWEIFLGLWKPHDVIWIGEVWDTGREKAVSELKAGKRVRPKQNKIAKCFPVRPDLSFDPWTKGKKTETT